MSTPGTFGGRRRPGVRGERCFLTVAGPTGQELLQHGLAIRQAVLKREPVDDVDRFALAQASFGICGIPHERRQMPFERRAADEVDQSTLQLCAALDKGGERCPVAAIVHDL
jgi:hypothetical protein